MEYNGMQVKIGSGSNIQEIRAFNCNRPDKKVKINKIEITNEFTIVTMTFRAGY